MRGTVGERAEATELTELFVFTGTNQQIRGQM